jgi:chromosome segregation ATPase
LEQNQAELEKQLQAGQEELAGLKAELEQHTSERQGLESQWVEKVNVAKAAAEQAESTWKEEAARCGRLERELSQQREANEERKTKFVSERKAAKQRIKDLEKQLQKSVSELEQAKADLENYSTLNAKHQEVAAKSAEMGEELCRLRENEMASQTELAELESRISDSVASLARATAELERERGERRRVEERSTVLVSQLQSLHGELKQHLESEKVAQVRIHSLEEELRVRDEALDGLNAELQNESSDRQLAEEQLLAAGDVGQQMRKYLSLFEESKKVFKNSQGQLEQRLQSSLNSLMAAETKLQEHSTERQRLEEALSNTQRQLQEQTERTSLEISRLQSELQVEQFERKRLEGGAAHSKSQEKTAERQRLEEALAKAQRELHEQTERTALEISRLQSELQVEQFERKRLEGNAAHSRYASLDSARASRAMVSNLRRQIRKPVKHLLQSTRDLLDVELPEPQKEVLQSILENALLVQTSIQKAGKSGSAPASAPEGEAPEGEAPSENTDQDSPPTEDMNQAA